MALSFETDQGLSSRAALGLIVLQTDETIESEFKWMIDLDDVCLYHSRVPSGEEVTQQTLARMEAEIPRAVNLLPSGTPLSVIGYACTSGSAVIGEDRVAKAITSARPGVATTNPISAAKAALQALGVKRPGFITPYVADVSLALRDNLEQAGFVISGFSSFEQIEEKVVTRISPHSVLDGILDIGAGQDCDGVFVSCTNLRVGSIIEEAEKRLSKPVISSNQALAWHMLRLAGINDPIAGKGSLLKTLL
ncbi:MAG: aspartate/glutamate racemase family protein [Rhodospirillaceae bacterium]|nr:aspartate/glutamate racemase family protein [Rhodospirillaceae bacterium]MBL6942121.1 aspartate/glutamate racemase family protein [Rhodospirillales bacterium]